MNDRVRTIARDGCSESVVKKSRFICSLARVTSEEEAREFLASIRKSYWDANHHCSAWVIGPQGEQQRSNDDGEPSGTAGSPMLNVLNQQELTDVIAVVTRFFGGTLLGAGGLTRAYGHAVSDGIADVGLVERKPLSVVQVRASHEDAGRLDNAIRSSEYALQDVDYAEHVTFTLHMAEDRIPEFDSWISELTSGRSAVEAVGVEITEVPVNV